MFESQTKGGWVGLGEAMLTNPPQQQASIAPNLSWRKWISYVKAQGGVERCRNILTLILGHSATTVSQDWICLDLDKDITKSVIKSKQGIYHCCCCIWQPNPFRQKQFMCGPKWLIRSCFKQLVSSYWKGKSWWNWQGQNFRLLYTLLCKAVCRANDNLVLIVYLWQFAERHFS